MASVSQIEHGEFGATATTHDLCLFPLFPGPNSPSLANKAELPRIRSRLPGCYVALGSGLRHGGSGSFDDCYGI